MSDRDLIEWDWLDSTGFTRLHHANLTDEQATELVDEGALGVTVTSCGRRIKRAWIPGPFSRLNTLRCSGCCDALGYPYGIGSPKNDPACRPLVEARIAGGS